MQDPPRVRVSVRNRVKAEVRARNIARDGGGMGCGTEFGNGSDLSSDLIKTRSRLEESLSYYRNVNRVRTEIGVWVWVRRRVGFGVRVRSEPALSAFSDVPSSSFAFFSLIVS